MDGAGQSNDEAIVAVLAHEMYELERLRPLLSKVRHRLKPTLPTRVREFPAISMIGPGTRPTEWCSECGGRKNNDGISHGHVPEGRDHGRSPRL